MNWFKKLRGGALVSLGYMLSPLSWWNDLFFNLPLPSSLATARAGFNSSWFVPGTVIGYWLSNVVGIVMMQFGAGEILSREENRNLKRDLLLGLGGATLYTLVVAALVYLKVLKVPDFLMV